MGQKEVGAIEPERFPEIIVNTEMSCFLHYHTKCFTRNDDGLFIVFKLQTAIYLIKNLVK